MSQPKSSGSSHGPRSRRDPKRWQVDIIQPEKLEDFEQTFSGAASIRGYNPPMTLLKHHSEHRLVIQRHLESGGKYDIIVGREGARAVREMYDIWRDEVGSQKIGELLRRANVAFFNQEGKIRHQDGPCQLDLHTEIHEWGPMKSDLRGFSFFLFEKRDGSRSALLYLLGEPFAELFIVPMYAIRISEVEPAGGGIYEKLEGVFKKRWRVLSESDVIEHHPTSFPEFVKQRAL